MHETVTTFRALGTTVFIAVRSARELEPARRLAAEVLTDVDDVCSRFRRDSDLTKVNASPGRWVEVDPLLTSAVEVACDAARQTGGLVNPLLGRALVQLGYDRDFDQLVEVEADAQDDSRAAPQTSPSAELPRIDAWREISSDPFGRLRIPSATALDLGAIGKAWSADLVAAAYEQRLRGGAVISVGGDLRIANPDGTPWVVAVSERPGSEAQLVALDAGGMATSSTQVRRWTSQGARRHHVLDPCTGRPAREVWRTATATGPTCTAANTASTAAIVLGRKALRWLAERSVTARLVDAAGTAHAVGPWPATSERSVA